MTTYPCPFCPFAAGRATLAVHLVNRHRRATRLIVEEYQRSEEPPAGRTVCEQRGFHVRVGQGTSTGNVLWSSVCRDCSAPVDVSPSNVRPSPMMMPA